MKSNRQAGFNLGYVTGFCCLAAAVVYFYASNWGGMERMHKFVPLFCFTLGLYALSAFLARRPGRLLLARLSLLGSCISFGVGLAVVGQTYNSHADSYMLFAIWAIPALLFSVATRWQPFYVLAYVLAHLAYWFYFSPLLDHAWDAEGIRMAVLAGLAAVQGALFLLTERRRLQSPAIRFVAFCMLIGLLVSLSNSLLFETYGWMGNVPLAAVLAGFVYYFKRIGSKLYLLFTGVAVSATVVVKYIEIAVRNFNEAFFIVSLLFVIAFVWGNVRFLKYLQSLFPAVPAADPERNEGASGTGEEDRNEAERGGGPGTVQWMIRILSGSAIVIGTILGTLSLIGILLVVFDLDRPEAALHTLGLLLSAGSLLGLRRVNAVFRYTLLGSGLSIGVGTALVYENEWMMGANLILLLAALFVEPGKTKRAVFYVGGLLLTGALLYEWWRSGTAVLTVLLALLLLVLLVHRRAKPEEVRLVLRYCSFPALLLVFFMLTFITKSAVYYTVNALFFLATLLLAFAAAKYRLAWVSRFSLGFWLAYVFWKYYDLAWKLLHKSFSLAAAGTIILLAVYWLEKRWRDRDKEKGRLLNRRWVYVTFALVLLQLAALSLQIGKSEWTLAHGQTIKLELAPRDPRSLLQGDYVELRYAISSPDALAEGLARSYRYKEKVSVVLYPAPSGVYEYRRLYAKGEPLQPGEVVINGKWNGYNGLVYGIESYFVPEGTGLEVERTAKFAEVKVAAGGDALLVRLLPQ